MIDDKKTYAESSEKFEKAMPLLYVMGYLISPTPCASLGFAVYDLLQ